MSFVMGGNPSNVLLVDKKVNIYLTNYQISLLVLNTIICFYYKKSTYCKQETTGFSK